MAVRKHFATLAFTFSIIGLATACSSTGSSSIGELNYAIMNDDLTAVRSKIADGANVNGTNNDLRTTPIHTAASRGNLTIVRELVESGAEVEVADCSGRTALMWAADNGSVAVSRYLIEKGADVNRRGSNSKITCERGHPDDTPLTLAAQKNHPELVDFLLASGAKAGSQRALAFALADAERDAVAKRLRNAGIRADENTARMVAEVSRTQKQQAATQTANAQQAREDDPASDLASAAVDAAVVGTLLSIVGF